MEPSDHPQTFNAMPNNQHHGQQQQNEFFTPPPSSYRATQNTFQDSLDVEDNALDHALLEQLYNAMKLSDELSPSFTSVAAMLEDDNMVLRNHAIIWIKQCSDQLFGVSRYDARDTSIQVFDKFLLSCYIDYPSCMEDMDFLAYSAAASLVIAGKLLDMRSPATMSQFSSFELDKLMQYERDILKKVSCAISPICTPSNFLQYLMALRPDICDSICNGSYSSGSGDINDERGSQPLHAAVMDVAQSLIAQFWEVKDSMLYAPSTVAIAALIISFPLHKVPSKEWLHSIPCFCLMDAGNPLFECSTYFQMLTVAHSARHQAMACGAGNRAIQSAIATATRHGYRGLQAKMMDVQACVAALEQLPYLRNLRASLQSSSAQVVNVSGASNATTANVAMSTSGVVTSDSCDIGSDTIVGASSVDNSVNVGMETEAVPSVPNQLRLINDDDGADYDADHESQNSWNKRQRQQQQQHFSKRSDSPPSIVDRSF